MNDGLVAIQYSDRTVRVSPETARTIWKAQNEAAVWESQARLDAAKDPMDKEAECILSEPILAPE